MKLEAKIEWVIDDNVIGVKAGQQETVLVDSDYVESEVDDVIDWIEDELSKKYGHTIRRSSSPYDGDFDVLNLSELIEDLKFQDFQLRTSGF